MACFAIGGSAVGLALTATGPEVTGCTTHQCDQSSYDWPPAVGGSRGGFMQSEDFYVTNDINTTWLGYNGNTTIRLWFPPEVAGRIVQTPVVDVGLDDMPNAPFAMEEGLNYTTAVGQLAILNALMVFPEPVIVDLEGKKYRVGGSVTITNTTCASYFVHVEVTFVRPLADAGVEGSG
jgi:hypothetical protein